MRRFLAVLCFLVSVFALVSPAPAAIVLIQKTQASNNGGTPSQAVSFGATPTVGNTVIIGIVADTGDCGIQRITDNQAGLGNVYARLLFANFQCGSSTNEGSVWCAPVQFASGTFTVTATMQSNTFVTVFALEYSGLSCNGDQVTFGTSTASPYACGSFTTTNASDLLISLLSLNSASTAAATPPAGFTTQLSQTNPAMEIGFYADQIVTSTGSFTPSWTSATTPFLTIPCLSVNVKAASGGGGGGGQSGYPTLR